MLQITCSRNSKSTISRLHLRYPVIHHWGFAVYNGRSRVLTISVSLMETEISQIDAAVTL